MRVFKLGKWAYKRNYKFLQYFCERYIRAVYSMSIKMETRIGEGVKFGYGGIGVVIHPKAVIGKNVTIAQNVTIGMKNVNQKMEPEINYLPVIGDNVYIGAGAVVLGGINIGNNVTIGANSVVISDVEENTVVAGIPARVIKKNV
ncbi:TPA: serine acetyltransferase [Vibrio vulnificus]|nr:serine acetyltransferase [Vibrio vulnificus]ELK8439792.1 serine acetyltransferase [Vibrio vulnificus]ELK8508822.1 serine acetyltransferase [Vibrio vulnificus]ELK8995300.1 serine acetyltransferase [Vibrio vulnificus]HAS6089098.1 serine acetyltransferase [Vibrio vulnificus]